MTREEQVFLEIWFENYIDGFRNQDGVLHPMLELKRCHSLRVAENVKFITGALKLPEEECLAEGTGLVHDIGRFTQFARFGSFCDADTVNHGAEGRIVLETHGISLQHDCQDWEQLLFAVEYHNRNLTDIPCDFNSKQDFLLRLIRDADKLDIMEFVLSAVVSDGFRDLPLMLPNISLCRKPSPEVLEEAQNTQSVSSCNLSTLADLLIMIATWFYDLNYEPTLHLILQRDILSRIQKELPETKAVSDIFGNITDRLLKNRYCINFTNTYSKIESH
jgi:hypothetical protein